MRNEFWRCCAVQTVLETWEDALEWQLRGVTLDQAWESGAEHHSVGQ